MSSADQFAYIDSVIIDGTKFGGSLTDLNEPAVGANADPPLWDNTITYGQGDRVCRSTTHRIYQRAVAGLTATPPESDTANWVDVGPTNKWAMWDLANSTQTQRTDDFSFYVFLAAADSADTMVFDNVDADAIRVTAYDSGLAPLGYDATIALKKHPVDNWYDHFFAPFVYSSAAVFSGLPPLTGSVFAVTVTKTGSIAKVGTCVLGRTRQLGGVRYGASVGIVDYSVKTTDAWGNTTVVERPYSKRMNVVVQIRTADVDNVIAALAPLRAKPTMYLGAGGRYASMLMFGYYRSLDVVIPGPAISQCNLEVESLT